MVDHPPVDVVESFLADFEAAWAAMKIGNSQAPRIEDYLPPSGHPAHLAILIELACVNLERSWEQGRRPEPETYFQRFPILAEDADGRGQLAFEDYRQRLLAGLAPGPRTTANASTSTSPIGLSKLRPLATSARARPAAVSPGACSTKPSRPAGCRWT